jgi:LemA protein
MALLEIVCCVGSALVAGVVVFYVVSIFNGLITLKNNIEKAWANIDVMLKQRSDMIPALVEMVRSYAKYEKGVMENITKIRSQLASAQTPSQKALANEQISSILRSLMVTVENYPNLKASENFLELQKALTAIENQIADRREFYNDSVLLYNTKIKMIPDMVFATLFGFREKEYFKVSEEDKKLVDTKIDV